ncbi:MAG: hypothetical protein LBM93_08005 [Oscillospiraceae bacterium]|jgi:hypothetical protein|nr:hypothetical protein [Oscillospiraceae bacterium]
MDNFSFTAPENEQKRILKSYNSIFSQIDPRLYLFNTDIYNPKGINQDFSSFQKFTVAIVNAYALLYDAEKIIVNLAGTEHSVNNCNVVNIIFQFHNYVKSARSFICHNKISSFEARYSENWLNSVSNKVFTDMRENDWFRIFSNFNQRAEAYFKELNNFINLLRNNVDTSVIVKEAILNLRFVDSQIIDIFFDFYKSATGNINGRGINKKIIDDWIDKNVALDGQERNVFDTHIHSCLEQNWENSKKRFNAYQEIKDILIRKKVNNWQP